MPGHLEGLARLPQSVPPAFHREAGLLASGQLTPRQEEQQVLFSRTFSPPPTPARHAAPPRGPGSCLLALSGLLTFHFPSFLSCFKIFLL